MFIVLHFYATKLVHHALKNYHTASKMHLPCTFSVTSEETEPLRDGSLCPECGRPPHPPSTRLYTVAYISLAWLNATICTMFASTIKDLLLMFLALPAGIILSRPWQHSAEGFSADFWSVVSSSLQIAALGIVVLDTLYAATLQAICWGTLFWSITHPKEYIPSSPIDNNTADASLDPWPPFARTWWFTVVDILCFVAWITMPVLVGDLLLDNWGANGYDEACRRSLAAFVGSFFALACAFVSIKILEMKGAGLHLDEETDYNRVKSSIEGCDGFLRDTELKS